MPGIDAYMKSIYKYTESSARDHEEPRCFSADNVLSDFLQKDLWSELFHHYKKLEVKPRFLKNLF